ADAYDWYETHQPGLGIRFIQAVDARISWIQQNPLMSEIVYQSYRRCLVPPFPYAIIYDFEEDRMVINSVFHCSQDPRNLRRRLR
ncbi:MAG TPA: type II toxin-antitoxin system RelE/ParE family toxin, partial [Pirellulales bacterium]|nr:type II toxin-antitoxin system RelE/ParE family toxin [Pirellulales bacterium]